jgi:hypothetical protein
MNHSARITLLALLVFILSMPMMAQQLRLGGGYSGSNVVEAGDEQWVGRAGYLLGADMAFGSTWFLRPGIFLNVRNLNYSIAGLDPNGDPTGTDVEFQYTSRSLRVPLHVGRRLFDPADDTALNIYLFAGPTALLNLNADLDNDALNVSTSPAQWYLGGGAGLEVAFLFVEAGYDVAMTNVFEGQTFRTNPKVNNAYALAGLRFNLAQ